MQDQGVHGTSKDMGGNGFRGGVLEYEPAKTDDMTWGENSLQVSGLPKKAAPGRLTGSDIFQWKMVTDVTA